MTRQELYDIVWSAPMSAVAKQLGVSDKSIAARCQKYAVPSPPRGHWTKAASSQTSTRPPLEGDAAAVVPMAADRAPRVATSMSGIPAVVAGDCASRPAPRTSDAPAADISLVRAMAGELQQHEQVLELLSVVATRATTLAPYDAAQILNWVTTIRAQLELQHPAERLTRLIRAATLTAPGAIN